MRIFLTGATGYIGTAVAERLQAAGHEVSGLARTGEAAAKLTAAGVRPVRGDFADPATVGAAAGAADGVISTATTYKAEIDGPAIEAILGALAGSGKPFLYTSGIWVHGDTGGAVVDEESPLKPATLVVWRVPVENRVLAGAAQGIRSAGRSCISTIWPTCTWRPSNGHRREHSCWRWRGLPAPSPISRQPRAVAGVREAGQHHGLSKRPDRPWAPTRTRSSSISRPPAATRRHSWRGGPAGPISSKSWNGAPM